MVYVSLFHSLGVIFISCIIFLKIGERFSLDVDRDDHKTMVG